MNIFEMIDLEKEINEKKKRVVQNIDISFEELKVVLAVYNTPDKVCFADGLSKELGINSSKVSKAVKQLEKNGYLIKQRNFEDERRVKITVNQENVENIKTLLNFVENALKEEDITSNNVMEMNESKEQLQPTENFNVTDN